MFTDYKLLTAISKISQLAVRCQCYWCAQGDNYKEATARNQTVCMSEFWHTLYSGAVSLYIYVHLCWQRWWQPSQDSWISLLTPST